MYGYGNSLFLTANKILASANAGTPPVNTVAPAITGTAQEGQTVTCSTGTWTGTPTITYAYQWKRNGSNIGSATNSTYTLVTADVSQSITCEVTATNGVGSANATSNTITPTSAVDPDAQAFITAAAITDPTQQSAINQLVVDLKGYSIWTKMKALYPFVGGTASTHKWNLKDPRDLDAAFRLVFSGGWTHSSNGILGNGVNSWADTFVVLNTLTRDSNSTGIYIRTNISEDKTDYGIFDTGANGSLQLGARSLANLIGLRNGSNQADSISNTDSRGFFQMTRRNSSNYVVAKNTTKSTITRTATDAFGNANKIPLGCLEFGGKFFFSSKQFALFYIGNTSLSDTELDNMNTAVQAFQVALSRNI